MTSLGRYNRIARAAGLGACVLATPLAAWAASETVVYAFTGNGLGGINPISSLVKLGSRYYGATRPNEPQPGTVFSVTAAGYHVVVHAFPTGSGETTPSSNLINVGGTLYGMTINGGNMGCSFGCGTVYSVTPNGTFATIHQFQGGSDGALPYASLLDVGGVLYGTTGQGGGTGCGGLGCGTVFSITPQGVETVVYSFQGGSDGALPESDLISVGNVLYGTTRAGGGASCHRGGCGTVFAVTTQGAESVLYAFPNYKHGAFPSAGLLKIGNVLYGTTENGGAKGQCCGTVFSVTLDGHHEILHSFSTGGDAAAPMSRLSLVGSTLYGTTSFGGAHGLGAIYAVALQGTETVAYSFQGGSDGNSPAGGLIDVAGTLYGTTTLGGYTGGACSGDGCGTVFSFIP